MTIKVVSYAAQSFRDAATMKYYFFVKQKNLIVFVREMGARQKDLNGMVVANLDSLPGHSRGGHSSLDWSSSVDSCPSFGCPLTFRGDSFLPY